MKRNIEKSLKKRYKSEEGNILIKITREKLCSFVQNLQEPDYIQPNPYYQSQPWNTVEKSRLIESFVMNIPMPPLELCEESYGKHFIIDGQQRVTAIREFFSNKFALEGMEIWPELNGRFYQYLPEKLKNGLVYRSVILHIAIVKDGEDSLRRDIFARINAEDIEIGRKSLITP